MLDLSPEKLMVLMAIGLMVLGPNRLPEAARTLAQGLARARRLTATLSDPIRHSLAEPNRAINETVTEFRAAVRPPTLTSTPPPTATPAPIDPTLN
jgi:sec-independent protein translocase protein TatB